MKTRFTERDTEERLQALPKLRLDDERRDEILRHMLSQVHLGVPSQADSALRRLRRSRRSGAVAAAAAVLVVGGVFSIYADGKFGAGSLRSGNNKTTRATARHPNQWMSDFQKRKLVAEAVANLYHGQPLNSAKSFQIPGQVPIVSLQVTHTADGQRAYHIKMKGKFTNQNHQQAEYLSFMVSADGSKVWDVTATNGSLQTQWTVKTVLHPHFHQLVYTGGNQNWSGVYRQGTVNVWWKDANTEQTLLGSGKTSKGMVWYTGNGPAPHVTAYNVSGGGASSSYATSPTGSSSLPTIKPQFSLPDLGMILASNPIHVSITANGNKVKFLLRDVSSQDASPIPMMKVTTIQPQAGGVLIHVQGRAQPAMVAIDSRQTEGGNGSHGPQASFMIRDATVRKASLTNLTKFDRSGNQFIRSITVTPRGSDLLVQLNLNQPVNTLNAGVTGPYIGVSLQNQPSPELETHVRAAGYFPKWFVFDLLFAGSYEGTPMKPVTYGQMAPTMSSGKYVLSAPLDPEANPGESVSYTTYYGGIPMLRIFKDLTAGGSSVSSAVAQSGYVKELRNGKVEAVKVMLYKMNNAWGFGFATNQVIVYSRHGGFYTYTVYPVPDISGP